MAHRLRKVFFSLAVCSLSFYGASAYDDLYFSPKRQKELDRQQAERRANEVSVLGIKRGNEQPQPQQAEEGYTESWGDLDSLESRPNSKIYEIERNNSYGDDQRDEDSYAERLRYDDPTYVVYLRDPYWYDPWWSYPYAGLYGTWGGRWGWGLSWGYPYYYYGYGWGYPYYGWGYPHYGWGYPWGYWGGHHSSHYANVTHRQRTGNMSGANRGTGYTSGRVGSGQRYGTGTKLTVPSYRGIRGSGSTSAAQPSLQTPQQKQSNATSFFRRIRGAESSSSTPVEQRSSSATTRDYGSSSSAGSSSRSSGSSSYGASSSRSSSGGGGSSSRGSSSGRR